MDLENSAKELREACQNGASESDVLQALIAVQAAEREWWATHLRNLAAGHQRAADMSDSGAVAQRHDAMAAALLAAEDELKKPMIRDCGEAGHAEGRCGNAACLRGA
jgi:hypothetical protein